MPFDFFFSLSHLFLFLIADYWHAKSSKVAELRGVVSLRQLQIHEKHEIIAHNCVLADNVIRKITEYDEEIDYIAKKLNIIIRSSGY